jgi:hypothetical protein
MAALAAEHVEIGGVRVALEPVPHLVRTTPPADMTSYQSYPTTGRTRIIAAITLAPPRPSSREAEPGIAPRLAGELKLDRRVVSRGCHRRHRGDVLEAPNVHQKPETR